MIDLKAVEVLAGEIALLKGLRDGATDALVRLELEIEIGELVARMNSVLRGDTPRMRVINEN